MITYHHCLCPCSEETKQISLFNAVRMLFETQISPQKFCNCNMLLVEEPITHLSVYSYDPWNPVFLSLLMTNSQSSSTTLKWSEPIPLFFCSLVYLIPLPQSTEPI